MTNKALHDSFAYAASTVAIDNRAILLCGPSGIGKSAISLLLMDRGAALVSDDQTQLFSQKTTLFAMPHPNIADKIEIRNLGIVQVNAVTEPVPVALKVNLDREAPRYREKAKQVNIADIAIPEIDIRPDLNLAPLKIEYALKLYGLCAT